MARALKIAVSTTLLFIGGLLLTHYTRLLECASISLSGLHYILVLKGSTFTRGDIVSIQGHEPLYVGKKLFTKRVVGLPGDHILTDKESLKIVPKKDESRRERTVPHEIFSLPLLRKTKEGYPLTPIVATSVPSKHVFVAGDHSQSFDSRYQEFGFVPISKIWGRSIFAW